MSFGSKRQTPKLPPAPKPPKMPKFEMPEIPAPAPTPPPPTAANDSVQQAALDMKRQAARRRGYRATLVSAGTQAATTAPASKPTLG